MVKIWPKTLTIAREIVSWVYFSFTLGDYGESNFSVDSATAETFQGQPCLPGNSPFQRLDKFQNPKNPKIEIIIEGTLKVIGNLTLSLSNFYYDL